MAESEIIKAIASTGVGGLIAWGIFLLYRRDIRDAKKAQAALVQQYAEQAKQSMEVVVNNTRAMAQLESTNAHLSRAIEAANITVKRGRDGEV